MPRPKIKFDNPSEALRLGGAASRLLEDEAVRAVLLKLEGLYVEEFKRASDVQELQHARAKFDALMDLGRQLRSMADEAAEARRQMEAEIE